MSIIDGFVPLLGPLPLQFCMIFTMIVSVHIPHDVDDKRDPDAIMIY